jgi:hypothetical protein
MRLAKTEAGVRAMKDHTLSLTARQRAALILCDAKRPRTHVLHNLATVGSTEADLIALKQMGLVQDVFDADEEAALEEAERRKARAPLERYKEAYPIAAQLAASLGFKSLKLSLAVERADGYESLCEVAKTLQGLVRPEAYAALHKALYD